MQPITSSRLTKRFGDVTAVRDLDLSVEEGSFYGFIGPNGAGKTTTINILTGQTQPTSGSATVMGTDPVLEPTAVRAAVGIIPEREDPPSFMTPREYFEFVADIRGIEDQTPQVKAWADRLGFREQLDTVNMDLSKGEKQKVMVTQAFLHAPELVFIDEPLTNLDPLVQERLKSFLQEYHDRGNTLFLSTHVMSLAEQLCTDIGVLYEGELVAETRMEELEQDGARLVEYLASEVERVDATAMDD